MLDIPIVVLAADVVAQDTAVGGDLADTKGEGSESDGRAHDRGGQLVRAN